MVLYAFRWAFVPLFINEQALPAVLVQRLAGEVHIDQCQGRSQDFSYAQVMSDPIHL